MLFPSDGIEGIKRFYLDSLVAFGKRGLACQPAIIGIGLGGAKDACMVLGKRAACLRTVGNRNSDPRIAELEDELKELGNSIGMGAMGFVGKIWSSTAILSRILPYWGYADVCTRILPVLPPCSCPHPCRWTG